MITPVKIVMTKKIISVPIGTTLFEANQLMFEKRLRHLPVIDESNQVIGLLSQRDLKYVPNSRKISVELMMSTPVKFVDQNLSLRNAIFQMLQNKISSLLVIDNDDAIIGIVTSDDLLWHLSHLLINEVEENATPLDFKVKQTIGEFARVLSEIGI